MIISLILTIIGFVLAFNAQLNESTPGLIELGKGYVRILMWSIFGVKPLITAYLDTFLG